MPSAMTHTFSQVPKADIPRSSFNRTHGWKGTFDAGYLIPFYVDEALPGDTFNLSVTTLCRLATPIVPIMDNLYVDTFFFFVPNRLIWSHWKEFNGENTSGAGIQSTSYVVPYTTSDGTNGVVNGTLFDYMGIPTGSGAKGLQFDNLHGRAYNLIYNEWFRDQNLIAPITVDLGDGPDTITNYVLQRRGKRHDYFTSALPWPQKGTAVTLPLGTVAPVGNLSLDGITGGGALGMYQTSDYQTAGGVPAWNATMAAHPTYSPHYNWYIMQQGTANNAPDGNSTTLKSNAGGNLLDSANANAAIGVPFGQLTVDLTNATATTINAVRQAFQIQKLYERDARGGTRYTEIIRSHFGVVSPDARLQRPEFLGGSSRLISVNPVAQTSAANAQPTPQGNLAAYAVSSNRSGGFTKSFTEHGVLIGLINVRADLNYQQGLNRMFSRSTRFDFYWPALSHLGEQSILNKEIYAQGTNNAGQDAAVFGYQERYAEYRYKPSVITGQYRSTYSTPLDMWHLAQKFTSLPALNQAFIEETPPVSRILAVGTGANGAQLLCDAYFQVKTARPMPTYSVPGLIDHF